jgi:hypothetical protein
MSTIAPKCGNCKFKGEVRTICVEKDLPDDPDHVEYVDMPTTFFLCTRIKHIRNPECGGYVQGLRAGVIDGSDYQAALCVEEDFGCFFHEPADPNT